MKLLKEQVMPTSKALVFDIKRFAVHDGDGLRTTVFFKGCPLRCKWCQNPEGLDPKREPIYMKSQCIKCGYCLKNSMNEQVTWKDGPVFDRKKGNYDKIVDGCPSGAICYDSKYYTLDELLEKIKSDEVFFRHNGGVTFSGGEPFMQGKFLIDILKACKKEGINTAIESSFFTDLELVKEAAQYLDRIFADMKVFDEDNHKEATNQSNEKIKENIQWLLQSEHKDKVIIRTPLIPGYTANKENIAKISSWISNLYPDVKYELLNYNPLAESKYEMTGRTFSLPHYKVFTKQEMDGFKACARENGIKNLIEE